MSTKSSSGDWVLKIVINLIAVLVASNLAGLQPEVFHRGDQVIIPVQGGVPSDMGLGERVQAEVVWVDGIFLDIKFSPEGSTHRMLAAFAVRAGSPALETARLKGHSSDVTGVSFSSDGTKLASFSAADGGLKIRDTSSMEIVREMTLLHDDQPAAGQLGAIAFVANSDGLIVLAGTRELLLLPNALVPRVEVAPGVVDAFAISANGKTFATVGPPKQGFDASIATVDKWDVESILNGNGKVESERFDLTGDRERTCRISISDQGELVIVACLPIDPFSKSTIWMCMKDLGAVQTPFLATLEGQALAISHVQDGVDYLPMFIHGNEICELGSIRCQLEGLMATEGRIMTQTAFAPDNQWIVAAMENGQLHFFDGQNGKRLASFPTGSSGIRALAVAPDGKSIATSAGQEIVVWSVDRILAESASPKADQ